MPIIGHLAEIIKNSAKIIVKNEFQPEKMNKNLVDFLKKLDKKIKK